MIKSIDSENMAQTSTILGVDFGKSKIGLAIADNETKMAFAYDTLANDKSFFAALKEIVSCEKVKTIVIGMTAHEKDPQSAEEKERFAEKIKKEINTEVVFQDEMFTTKMAHQNLKLRGGKNLAKTDDQEAARIILQSWLDRETAFDESAQALKHTRNS